MSETKRKGFGADASVEDSVNAGSDYINLSNGDKPIDTGRYIDSINYAEANGNAYLEVTVIDNDGKTASRRYFEPKIDGVIVKDEDALSKKQQQFSKLVANIGRRFLGTDYVLPETESFEQFCKKFISDLGEKYKGVELRVKLVMNNKNFTTLPAYAPAFELATVLESESSLKVNSIDKVKADVPATADKPETTPATSAWN